MIELDLLNKYLLTVRMISEHNTETVEINPKLRVKIGITRRIRKNIVKL